MKHTINILILGISVILFSSCNNKTKEENKEIEQVSDDRIAISEVQFEQNKMILGTVSETNFPSSISVNGMIDVPPKNKAVVNAIMGGFIKSIDLLEGDKVSKGQVLATVENPEFITLQQEYLEIKEQISYLEAEYVRQQKLFNEQITSQKNFLKAESQYKTALAKYKGLKKRLKLLNISVNRVENGEISSTTSIYAPISGSITDIHVTKGTSVSPTESILEIVDNSHIHLDLSVFEKDILKVKKGQIIRFKIPEISSESFDAKVHLVGTSINNDRTITVHGHPIQENKNLLTGMFVTAEIIIDESITKVIPESALVDVDSEHYILILDEKKDDNYFFKQVKVETGKTVKGFTELIAEDSMVMSQKILIEGAFSLVGVE